MLVSYKLYPLKQYRVILELYDKEVDVLGLCAHLADLMMKIVSNKENII